MELPRSDIWNYLVYGVTRKSKYLLACITNASRLHVDVFFSASPLRVNTQIKSAMRVMLQASIKIMIIKACTRSATANSSGWHAQPTATFRRPNKTANSSGWRAQQTARETNGARNKRPRSIDLISSLLRQANIYIYTTGVATSDSE